jgi:hypothetical protein
MPFTGVDIWPILAQAKAALSEPSILVTQRYLEGLWDGARFWRPGLTAYTALQWALFGGHPLGYHAMRLGLLALAAVLAGTLAARHGAAPRLAFGVAAVAYALHPLQAETVPVTSRDADTLATVLSLGALVALTGREPRPKGYLALGVVLALLAPTVKEPALLTPLLAIVVLEPWRSRVGRGAAVVASAGLGLGLVAQLFYRDWLLGTIGRYERELPMSLGETVRELSAGLLDHQRWGLAPIVALLMIATLVLWPLVRRSGQVPAAAESWPKLRRACLLWIAAGTVSYLSAPVFRLRYGEGLLAPLAVLAGAGVGAAWLAFQSRGSGRSVLRAAPLAALSVGLLLTLLPGTPLVWRYPQWELAGRVAEAVLATAGDTVAAAMANRGQAEGKIGRFHVVAEALGPQTAGALIEPFPFQPAEPQGRFAGRTANVAILAPYAIQAWFQLARGWPVGTIRVADGTPLLGVKPQDLGPGVTIPGY